MQDRKWSWKRTLKFTQPVLIQSYQDEFDLPTTSYKTPAEPRKLLSKVEEGQEVNKKEQKIFRSAVGKLLHMMRWSRPEIWNAVRECSRRMTVCNQQHMKAVHRTMKYCVDTKHLGWVLNPNCNWSYKEKDFKFEVDGTSDSNFANCIETRKSVTGSVVKLNKATVSVKAECRR